MRDFQHYISYTCTVVARKLKLFHQILFKLLGDTKQIFINNY